MNDADSKPLQPLAPVLLQALQVGAGAALGQGIAAPFNIAYSFKGLSGVVVGGAVGILRSATPGLFAAVSGLQWFVLGSSFWAARGAVLESRAAGTITSRDYLLASTIGGTVAGLAGTSLLRRRSSLLPAALMFSLVGLSGQAMYNALGKGDTDEHTTLSKPQPNILERIAAMKWSPMKALSDQEYSTMLKDKLHVVNTEIALIDDDVRRLREEAERSSTNGS